MMLLYDFGLFDPFNGFFSQKPDSPQTDCHVMADVAQDIANDVLMQYGDGSDALEEFDKRFTQQYLGGPPVNGIGAIRHYMNNYARGKISSAYWGESGFKEEFKENTPGNDQTHHFAAHFSAGINGMDLTSILATAFDNNAPDRALGSASYNLGFILRKTGTYLLPKIGSMIRTGICAGPGHGLYHD
jgi:hypothetical protein